MVFNATFNNISVISWWSVLLVEETGDSQKTTDMPQVTVNRDHLMLYRVHLAWVGFELTTLLVICTDCIEECFRVLHKKEYFYKKSTSMHIFPFNIGFAVKIKNHFSFLTPWFLWCWMNARTFSKLCQFAYWNTFFMLNLSLKKKINKASNIAPTSCWGYFNWHRLMIENIT